MDRDAALVVLKSLADGIHPVTGAVFAPDSPYQQPQAIRALLYAVHALEETSKTRNPAPGQAARAGAGNAGQPWSKEEDEKLLAAFDAGQAPANIAAAHGRSKVAIEARLAKFGRVPMPEGMRSRPEGTPSGGGTGDPRARDAARPAYAAGRA